MENIKNEKEEVKTERQPNVKRGLITLAVVGVGCGLYGYVKGRRSAYRDGYRRGFVDGEVFVNGQFRELAKKVIELKESVED